MKNANLKNIYCMIPFMGYSWHTNMRMKGWSVAARTWRWGVQVWLWSDSTRKWFLWWQNSSLYWVRWWLHITTCLCACAQSPSQTTFMINYIETHTKCMHSWLNLNKLDCTNVNFLVLKLQYNVTFVGGWINKGIHDIPILFFFSFATSYESAIIAK